MPYAILRFQKRKAGGVAACERHNERKKEAYKSNPDIDMERSKNNYHLIAPPKYTYKKEINRMVAEAGCRTRKDSVMMVETLITASPEFMNQLPPEEQKAYFQTALDFISEREKMADGIVKQEIKIYYKFIGFVDELHIIPTKRWAAMPAKNCTVCGVEYVPGSGASRYCPACAKKIRREKSNESKRRSREQKRIACMNCPQKMTD